MIWCHRTVGWHPEINNIEIGYKAPDSFHFNKLYLLQTWLWNPMAHHQNNLSSCGAFISVAATPLNGFICTDTCSQLVLPKANIMFVFWSTMITIEPGIFFLQLKLFKNLSPFLVSLRSHHILRPQAMLQLCWPVPWAFAPVVRLGCPLPVNTQTTTVFLCHRSDGTDLMYAHSPPPHFCIYFWIGFSSSMHQQEGLEPTVFIDCSETSRGWQECKNNFLITLKVLGCGCRNVCLDWAVGLSTNI